MKLILPYPLNMPFSVTQKFGENKNDFYAQTGWKGHNGWDFGVPEGTPIYATHDGVVTFASIDDHGGLGINLCTLEQFDYNGAPSYFMTQYWHCSKFLVSAGDIVKKGQQIGLSGNTGMSTGPHLHWGLEPMTKTGSTYTRTEPQNGYGGAVDPFPYLDGSYPHSVDKTKFYAMQQAILDFQVSEGLNDFVGKPLEKVVIGPKTLKAIQKYL